MLENATPTTDVRFHEEGDWLARQFFSEADLQMSPEEYAAHHAQHWGCFSLHLHPFRDANLGAWVRRLGEILCTKGEIERCRLQFLTPEDIAQIRAQETVGL